MNKCVRMVGAVALAVLMAGSYAGTTTGTASPILLLLGHIDAVHPETATAVVIGQVVHVSPTAQISPLLLTGIFGTLRSDGSIDESSVKTGQAYVAGASPILLTGVVASANPSLGQLKIGQVLIDINNSPVVISSIPAGLSGAFPKAGDLVQVMGVQPVEGGIILANRIRIGAEQILLHPLMTDMPAAANGQGGTGITGSGRQNN